MANDLLTILIPTLPRRWKFYNDLRASLAMQVYNKPVTIISNHDTDISIGVKRNLLMAEVETPYVCYIDDDDRINDNYISLILKALESDPDCCSLRGKYYLDDVFKNDFEHSIKHTEMKEVDSLLVRPINHLNTVRTEFAKQIPFPDWKYSEDSNYAFRLMHAGLLKTEAWIEETLYFYKCRSDKSILG